MTRFRPSKPAAILGAVVGVGMIVFALTSFHQGSAFLVFWCLVVAAITLLNLWAAFSPRGSVYEMQRDDSPRGRR